MTKDNALARTQDAKAGPTASLFFTQFWSSIMRKFVTFLVASGLAMGTALAHQQGKKLHLADAPPDQQVGAITYCNGVYRVTTKEGSPIEYREFDIRFKTDGGPDGPTPGTPVVTKAGMRGDRGFVIFSAPGEISPFIKTKC